eukprot:18472-Heterococcus_DN1.PRE.3
MSISPRLVQSFPGSLNVVALAVVVAVVWCGECALQWSCSAVPLGSAAAISPCDLHVVSSSMRAGASKNWLSLLQDHSNALWLGGIATREVYTMV